MNHSASELFTARTEEEPLVDVAVQLLPAMAKALFSALSDLGSAYGLTPAQVKVLLHLGTHGQMTIGEIAAGLSCSMPAASELVDRLVEAGHLLRTTDPADRRRVLIDAAPASAHVGAHLQELRRAQIRDALQRMAPDERPVFVKSLQALIAAMNGAAFAGSPSASAKESALRGNRP